MFGVSKVMIGASIVAIWTSVPELVTSVIAARNNQADMAVGNIIWSNIFNIVWIVWLCSVIRPVPVDITLNTDIWILFIVTSAIWFFLYKSTDRALHKKHGIILVCLYACYLWFLIWRG
jgi:cation:H+ antiporter